MSWFDAARARFRLLFSRNAESRMGEEFRFHLEMQTEQNIRSGMSPEEARRVARASFGGVETHKEEMRDGRGLAAFGGMSLDLKLGLRMLGKYPALALVGGFGIAIAVAIGTGLFAFMNSYLYPDLPLDEGERVVTIKNLDTQWGGDDPRLLHDFVTWRRDLVSIVDLGAFRTARRNLIGASGEGEPLIIAEMSASGFRVARVPPLLGRTLLEADEEPGASPVVVIGYDAWKSRFGGDPGIVGQSIRLGRVTHMVVGVMPEGFAFPVNHRYWVPFRADPDAYPVGTGPGLSVFGRIAPGSTLQAAQEQLSLIGRRTAETQPETHATLRPRILPYTDVFADGDGDTAGFVFMQAIALLVLFLVCANVAILVYARTVTRSGEIAVRTALGASRRRIVSQLFAEALVLSLVAAVAGMGLVAIGLRFLDYVLTMISAGGVPPFWIHPGVTASTAAYAVGLAILSSLIVGVLPGLKATGRDVRATLSHLSGGSKAQLGRQWTGLIIAQVAITVAILPPALVKGGRIVASSLPQSGFGAENVLMARLQLERERNPWSESDVGSARFAAAMGATQRQLIARLDDEPGVAGVTFADGTPGSELEASVEIEGIARRAPVGTKRVAVNFLDVFDVRLAAGRNFTIADTAPAASRPVIVDRRFVTDILGGTDALGRRVRFPKSGPVTGAAALPWQTIIGVVEDFPADFLELDAPAWRVYQPAAPGELQGVTLLVRLRGTTPAAFRPTLRRIATQVDPMLELRGLSPLDAVYAENRFAMRMLALGLGIGLASVLLLSAAGVYALMSFTVNQRRREIGVRAALGGDGGRILGSVLRRAIRQLALGVVAGLVLTAVLDRLAGGDLLDGRAVVVLPVVVSLMLVIGLLAAAGPALRGIRVHPTEALRAE